MKRSFLRSVLLFAMALFFISCNRELATQNSGWKLIYKNDKDGKTIFGKKEDLLKAIRGGKDIRIGWGGRRVEHVADAKFLTITNGKEAFAQIDPIIGQRPELNGDTLRIHFRENSQWTIIVGTNGFSDRLHIDRFKDSVLGHRNRPTTVSWFVENHNQ